MDDARLVCMGCMDSHQLALNSYESVHATLDKVTLTLTYDFWTNISWLDFVRRCDCVLSASKYSGRGLASNNGHD